MSSLALLLALPFYAPTTPSQATELAATYRSGQTFLTWTERADLTGESYRVYRHDAPIDSSSIDDATLLLEVPEGSAQFFSNRHRVNGTGTWQPRYLDRYVIEDDGAELSDGTGLLVWTLRSGEPLEAGAYYAVTTVDDDDEENRIDLGPDNSIGPLVEDVADPLPVQTGVDVGTGGTLFIQFMDVRAWNSTFHAPHAGNLWYGLDPADPAVAEGLAYAYEYIVYAPASAVCAAGIEPQSPVLLFLHGWNDNTYPAYLTDPFPEYCGYKILPVDVSETWWLGFAESHDFRTGGTIPLGDKVANFTENRVLRMVHDLLDDPLHGPAIDSNRVYVFGHSMGGSGALALALRYPQVFAAAHANDAMTRYATVGDGGGQDWRPMIEERWGSISNALPMVINGPSDWADALATHSGTNVWDWQDHQAAVLNRRADEIVLLGITHGSTDTTIEWTTQGRPTYALFDQADRCWGGAVLNEGHSWKDFAGLPPTLAADSAVVPFAGLSIVLDETVPGLSSCSADSPLPPAGTADYNHLLDWSSTWNAWDVDPLDQANRWEMSLRTLGATTIWVDVTPRRTSLFTPAAGTLLDWENRDIATANLVASGTVSVDPDGLVTVPGFEVGPSGNRLVLAPMIIAPAIAANFSASPATGVAPLSVSFTDLSTGSITSWAWDFGDGTTATERNPAHVYGTEGTYDVSLTVTGLATGDTLTQPALVQVSGIGAITMFGCGLNPAGSLVHLSGSPNLGQTFTLGVDNPLGTQGAGSRPTLYLSYFPDIRYPCGIPLKNWGMGGPGAFGEILIGRGGGNPFLRVTGGVWTGPGNPVPITIRTPTNPAFLGMTIYAQAILSDPASTFGVGNALTEAASIVIGP